MAAIASASSLQARTLANHPDSDFIPSILYTPTPSSSAGRAGQSRGRSYERTYEVIEAVAAAAAAADEARGRTRHRRSGSGSGSRSSRSSGRERRGSGSGSASRSGQSVVKFASGSGSGSGRRGSASSLSPETITSHHSLPVPSEIIHPNPILYLPPLLSPLPNGITHQHDHEHPHGVAVVTPEIPDFETRLPDIDPASLALHQALHHFSPLSEKYASTSYNLAFNWAALTLPKSVEREWYCVVFRSRRKPESSSLDLYTADREAHEEAVKNGGLVMYWYGVPDETGLNLATCIWQSRRHAINAISGPKHRSAMKQTQGAYEVYELERWVLSKEAGKRSLGLKKWESGEVGW